jgi:hypothetical protein
MSAAPSLLAAALELASAGWAVFPCHRKGARAKAPVSSLAPHGHLNATRDPEVIRRWWHELPDALIGGAVPASLLVIDIDPRNGGSLEAMEAIVGPLAETLTVWSGRNDGGRHLYYLRPAGEFTSSRLPPGIDLKANGYCILPPSPHPSTGAPYRWELRDPAPLPTALRELLRPAPPTPSTFTGPTNSDALIRFVAGLTRGERNRGTYWAACRAADEGTLPHLASNLIAAAVQAGLTEHEARRIVQSAARSAGVRR